MYFAPPNFKTWLRAWVVRFWRDKYNFKNFKKTKAP